VDVKRKEYIYISGCVCLYFFMDVFYDKIAKNKEEFNILICSQLRIMNLHVSCISNIR
jgi:hypothetical protein